jgi:glucose/arabinose dehydrogenase
MKTPYLLLFIFIKLSFCSLSAQNFPPNFYQNDIATGLANPTTFAFAPDGRIFLAEQNGKLRVIKNDVLLTTPFVTLNVDATGERGLIGVAIDPDFNTNKYIYLYYTTKTPAVHNRVSRFTADGDVALAGSELALLDLVNLTNATNHNGGAMAFGPDGYLYIAVGDNAQGLVAGTGVKPPQNLDSYLGKILRINRDGSVPATNPFFNDSPTSEPRKRIWASGLRNPYTFSIDNISGKIFLNEVGQVTWEEINDATQGGLNFGWPTEEGRNKTTNPIFVNPFYAYNHSAAVTTPSGCAITGGAFFSPTSTKYPVNYVGKYFFQDYCRGWIYYLDPSTASPTPTKFADGLGPNTLAISCGLDGNLYYLNRTAKKLVRIEYNQGFSIIEQPKSIAVNQREAAAFSVTVSGTGTSYQWQKNGVNIEAATQSTFTIPSVQLTDAGNYSVNVYNAEGSTIKSLVATLTVKPVNAKPVASIVLPTKSPQAYYSAGDIVRLKGTGTDLEDGTLTNSSFSWFIDFHHDTHKHDQPPIEGVTETDLTIPNEGETSANVWYRITLMVTDSQGEMGMDSVDVLPNKSDITLATFPTGLQLTLDGEPFQAPQTTTSVRGMLRSFEAPSPQVIDGKTYRFVSWSNGETNTVQTVATPQNNTTYIAVFKAEQTIQFSALPTKTFGDATVELSAIASSGLPITYTSSNPNVATIATNKVTIVGAGSCTITASQAGNESFFSVSTSQTLTVLKANQTIIFPALANKAITDAPFNLTASASSSLPIAYSTTSNTITLTNGVVGIVAAGRATVTASQAGNSNYNAADLVSQSFCINPAKPSIVLSNLNTPSPLLTSSAPGGNQWYLDGTAIAGATSATYDVTKTGLYQVRVMVDGCTGEFSDEQPVVITGIETALLLVEVYPNPVTDGVLSISFGEMRGKKQVTIFTLMGESLDTKYTESSSMAMDVANLTAGIYLAKVIADGAVYTKKFKKQ